MASKLKIVATQLESKKRNVGLFIYTQTHTDELEADSQPTALLITMALCIQSISSCRLAEGGRTGLCCH